MLSNPTGRFRAGWEDDLSTTVLTEGIEPREQQMKPNDQSRCCALHFKSFIHMLLVAV
jgi:hypothetical protein